MPNLETPLILIRNRVYTEGEFIFASGKHSTNKLEGDNVPEGSTDEQTIANELGDLMEEVGILDPNLSPEESPVLIGVPRGGERYANLIADNRGLRLATITNFKDPSKNMILEGEYRRGDTAVIIDDMFSTGLSSFRAALCARESGLDVARTIFGIADRESGAGKFLKQQGFDLKTLTTLKEVAGRTNMDRFREGHYLLRGTYEDYLPAVPVPFEGRFLTEALRRRPGILALYGEIADQGTLRPADIVGEIDQRRAQPVITFTKDYKPRRGVRRVNYELKFRDEGDTGIWVGGYELHKSFDYEPVGIYPSGPDKVRCHIYPDLSPKHKDS